MSQVLGGSVACPKCGRIDRVQKVTAVVAAGISTGLGGTRSVLMSQRLAPPDRPEVRSTFGALYFVLVISATVVGLGAIVNPHVFAALRVGVPVPLLFLGTAVLATAWALLARVRRHARVRWERAHWETAIARWYDLYYCGRDDGVYLPGQSELVSVELMNVLLYAPQI